MYTLHLFATLMASEGRASRLIIPLSPGWRNINFDENFMNEKAEHRVLSFRIETFTKPG